MGLFSNNNNEEGGNMRKGGGLRAIYKMAKPALNLSAGQESKIEAILGQLKAERESIKSNGNDNPVELRSARQQAKQQILEILNPDQKKIWQDNITTWKEQAGGPLK